MRRFMGSLSLGVRWRAGRVAIAALAAGSVLVAMPLFASASSSQRSVWSGPVAVDRAGANPLTGVVSCPSVDQCTTVDSLGQEVTFGPHSPGHTWRHMLDPGGATVSCPTTQLCVAVVLNSGFSPQRLLSFQPKTGQVIREWNVWPNSLDSIACPSTSHCTAVGLKWETTWNPQRAGSEAIISSTELARVDGRLDFVNCPAATVCIALEQGGPAGREVTFDPTSGRVNYVGVKDVGGTYLTGLSCFDSAHCTAVDELGDQVTFDSDNGTVNAAGVTTIEPPGDAPNAVSCPAANQCTAVDIRGNEVTFDPTSGTVDPAGVQTIHTGDANGYSVAVTCPATNLCTSVSGSGEEATFTPPSGAASATVLDPGQPLVAISCPSSHRCAAIDNANGFGLNLSTKKPRAGKPLPLGTSRALGVSCSSSTQCTAVSFPEHAEVTFNPVTNRVNAAGLRAIDPNGNPVAVSCPTTRKCVAIDFQGNDIVFNPSTGKVLTTGTVLQAQNAGMVNDLSCPSAHQCTVIDGQGNGQIAFTFNPGPAGPYVGDRIDLSKRYGMSDIQGIDCPSLTECVVVSGYSTVLAFKPTNGRAVGPGLVTLNPNDNQQLHGVSCSSARECVAISESSEALIFDPKARQKTLTNLETIPQAADLTGISCAPGGPCVAVDAAGNAFIAAQHK